MAKLLNPKEPVRFSPSDQLRKNAEDVYVIPEDQQITYLLKVPTHWDRVELRKALATKGARQHGRLGLLVGLRKSLEDIFDVIDPDGALRPSLLARIDDVANEMTALFADIKAGKYQGEDDELAKEFAARWSAVSDAYSDLEELRRLVAANVPRFAAMLADDEVFDDIFALVTAQKFVIGWENRDAAFKRDATGMHPDSLDTIPPSHIAEIGAKIAELLKPTETEAKNSVSPSLTSSSQGTSTAASTTDSTIH